MASNNLFFIQPHIVERLIRHEFVAKRQQSKAYRMHDRRNTLSPLNVTRRAIRYEPLVFTNRHEELVDCIQTLNSPDTKLLLISGPPGRGKTSFIRALSEMMDGSKAQLLWFDVSKHTDFDEVVRFLVEYLTYICRSLEETPKDVPKDSDPIEILEQLLNQTANFPILIAIDNIEHLVTPDQTVRSRELKEAFNFLLSFPNVKLILSGKTLPLSDMNPAAEAVYHLPLEPFNTIQSEALVKQLFHHDATKSQNITELVPFFHGEPYLLFLFATLFERHANTPLWFETLSQAPDNPEKVLLSFLYPHLSDIEKKVLRILALIRHGATPSGLQVIVRYCNPTLKTFDFKQINKSILRLLFKKVYPPQMVLEKLRHRPENHGENDTIEAYYQLFELVQEDIVQTIPEEERIQTHERLHQFYLAEKNKHIIDRIYQTRTLHLAAEAQYHFTHSKRRRSSPVSSEPFTLDSIHPQASDGMSTPERYLYMQHTAPQHFSELSSEKSIPWPNLETSEEDEVSGAYEITQSVGSSHKKGKSDSVSSTVPISIQIEPSATLNTPTVRLTDEDLEKLAQLITRTSHHTSSSTNPYIQSHLELPLDTKPEAVFDIPEAETEILSDLEEAPSLDLEEQEIQNRLSYAITQHDRKKIAEELLQLGRYRIQKGLSENGEACLIKALEYAEDISDTILQAAIYSTLGHSYREHFQHNKALRHLREVEHLYEKGNKSAKEQEVLPQTYWDMAEIYFYRKELEKAQYFYKKSLSFQTIDTPFKAEVLFRLALTLDDSGEIDEATRYYRQSFEVSSAIHDNYTCAATLYNLASLYFEHAQFEEAKKTLQECLVYDKQNGIEKDILRSLIQLSKICEAQHILPDAKQYATEAYEFAKGASNKTNLASVCLHLGHLAETAQSWEEAARYYQQAESAASELSEESRQRIRQKQEALKDYLS